MRLISGNPEVGHRIMEVLNIPVDQQQQQFSPGSVSLGGDRVITERRSSTVEVPVYGEPPMSNRLSWSSRNIDWRGDPSELRARPNIADIRYAPVQSGEHVVPVNESRTTTTYSPDGRNKTTETYTHKRSNY